MAQPIGEGSVTRLEQAPKARCRRWKIRFRMDDGGERTRRFTGTYSAAKAERERFRLELERPDRPEATFADYAVRWQRLREESGEYANSTLLRDQTALNRLLMEFGDDPLSALSRDRVADGLSSIRGGANPSGRHLSGTTMNKTFGTMKHVMRDAMWDGYIERNPLDMLKPPRRDTREKEAATIEQVAAMLDLLEARPLDSHTVGIRLAVLAGLRRGELCGLEWRDVGGGVIRVRRSVDEKTGEAKAPKSTAGLRSVPMLPQLERALAAWKVEQAAQLAALGLAQAPETPVLTSTAGTRLAAQNLFRWWMRAKPEFGVGCGLHELRHTFLTMLANSGASMQSLKSIAGWADISMANVYVHDDADANAAAVGMLGARFGGTSGHVPGGTSERARRVPQGAEILDVWAQ